VWFDCGAYQLTADAVIEGDKRATIDERGISSNAYDLAPGGEARWTPRLAECALPTFTSGVPLLDRVWDLAAETATLCDMGAGKPWKAGYKYNSWVRDSAYCALLGGALLDPEGCRATLEFHTEADTLILDQFPCSNDSTVWAAAAWEYYTVTGDIRFLLEHYEKLRRTLDRLERESLNEELSLFEGGSSFMDNGGPYPEGVYGEHREMATSTNCIFARTYEVMAEMARALGAPEGEADEFLAKAKATAAAVNEHLWDDEAGWYVQFAYADGRQEKRWEGLGEALAILWGIAPAERAARITRSKPDNPYGVETLFPYYKPDGVSMHDRSVWPFIGGLWAMAASRTGQGEEIRRQLAAAARHAALELSFRECMTSDGEGWRYFGQLWNAMGYIGLIVRGAFGARATPDALLFEPTPTPLPTECLTLSGLRWGGATLDVALVGRGEAVEKVWLDGKEIERAVLPRGLSGRHELVMSLDGRRHDVRFPQRRDGEFTPPEELEQGLRLKHYDYSHVDFENTYNYKAFRSFPYPPAGRAEASVRAEPVIAKDDPLGGQHFTANALEGWLKVERAGEYGFRLDIGEGGRLFVDGRCVVNCDGTDYDKPAPSKLMERVRGSAVLTAGLHTIRVHQFVERGTGRLSVYWTPPGEEEVVVPSGSLFHQPTPGD